MPWMPIARRCALAAVVIVAAARSADAQTDVATIATRTAEEWLGARPSSGPVIDGSRPLWQGRGSMIAEQQIATRTIRQWWPERIADEGGRAIVDGIATYLQTRVIEQAFDLQYLRQMHSVETRSYFGGHVAWSVPTLRLSRHAIAARDHYAAVFDSIERMIGTPALQSAIYEVAKLPANRLTADSIVKTMSDAAGQDLSWLFGVADADINYAVTGLTPNSVTVTREGSGAFTGRTAPRVGEFESGDGVQLKAVFADGSSTMAAWDGRDASRTFAFQSSSPVVAAYLDPNGIMTLDRNRLDNAIVPPSPTNVPVRKWVARWAVWLQHTMLSYGFMA